MTWLCNFADSADVNQLRCSLMSFSKSVGDMRLRDSIPFSCSCQNPWVVPGMYQKLEVEWKTNQLVLMVGWATSWERASGLGRSGPNFPQHAAPEVFEPAPPSPYPA